MQVSDLLRILRARWPIVAIVSVVGMVTALLLLPGGTPQRASQAVTATSTLVVDNAGGARGAASLSTMKIIASQGEVPAKVATALGTKVPALLAQVTITASSTTNSLSIVARDRSRPAAIKVADTYSKTLLEVLTSQARATRLAQRDALTQQIARLEADEAAPAARLKTDPAAKAQVDVIERQLSAPRAKLAQLDSSPPVVPGLRSVGDPSVDRVAAKAGASPLRRRPVRLALGGLLGLGGSLAVLVLIDRLDVRLRTRPATEAAFGLPVLAEVPELKGQQRGTLAVASEPQSAYAEAHRILRSSLVRPDPVAVSGADRRRPPLVVVTSAEPGEGKTATAANLAASLAEAGNDTLLVGLDLRHNDIHTLVPTGLRSEEIKLPAKREGAGPVRLAVRASSIPHLRLVTVVPSLGPALVLPVAASWLKGIHDPVDVIVVDTPPLLLCSDPSEVIPFADMVLVTCRVGHTRPEAAARAAELLDRLHAPVAGVVLVGVILPIGARKPRRSDIIGWTSPGGVAAAHGPDDVRRGLLPVEPTPSTPGETPIPNGYGIADDPSAGTADRRVARREQPLVSPDPVREVPGPTAGAVDVALPWASPPEVAFGCCAGYQRPLDAPALPNGVNGWLEPRR